MTNQLAMIAADLQEFLEAPRAAQAEAAKVEQNYTTKIVADVLVALGRKVELYDLSPAMLAEATRYARSYHGAFEYMIDMRIAAQGRRGLSDRQAKGVLNCWRAELVRNAKAEQAPAGDKVTEPGYYSDGETTYLVVENQAGTRVYAKRLHLPAPGQGGRAKWLYDGGAILRLTADQQLTIEEAARLGHLHGFCMVCGIRLDKPASVLAGIGPVCSKRLAERAVRV